MTTDSNPDPAAAGRKTGGCLPMAEDWNEFEIAVADFVAALGESASVRHNVHQADRQSGEPRQRDVWISAEVCGIPVAILVSCKRHRRKLHQGDIDAFYGEFVNSGANKGVLYSFSGYTKPAVKKAKALGLSCCKLYQNQRADLPEVLLFESFCCAPRFRVSLDHRLECDGRRVTWNELLEMEVRGLSVLDHLVNAYQKLEQSLLARFRETRQLPEEGATTVLVAEPRPGECAHATITISWRFWRGRTEAHYLDGSYSFTEEDFRGRFCGPAIDTQSTSPGPGWEEIPRSAVKLEGNAIMAALWGGDVRSALRRAFGDESASA